MIKVKKKRHPSVVVLMSFLLTLNIFHTFSGVSFFDIEHEKVFWDAVFLELHFLDFLFSTKNLTL